MYNIENGFGGKELINPECGQRPILYNKEFYLIRRFINILDCYLMDNCQESTLKHQVNAYDVKFDFILSFNATKEFSIDCKCDKISNEISKYILSNSFFESMMLHSRFVSYKNDLFSVVNVPKISISLFDVEDEMQLERFYINLNEHAERLSWDLINIQNNIPMWKELYKE